MRNSQKLKYFINQSLELKIKLVLFSSITAIDEVFITYA